MGNKIYVWIEMGGWGTMPWRSQNIEHHRTPELFGCPAKIYYLDNWNSLSNSCHVMPWQIYSIMEKNDIVKSGIFEKISYKVFFLSHIPSKINLKNTILSFSMTLLCLLTQLWGWNFHFSLVLNLNFWGVPSTFQGIVDGPVWLAGLFSEI